LHCDVWRGAVQLHCGAYSDTAQLLADRISLAIEACDFNNCVIWMHLSGQKCKRKSKAKQAAKEMVICITYQDISRCITAFGYLCRVV
jgi:hypothetical protein